MDRKEFKEYMNALTELRNWVQAGLDLCEADKEERDAALDADEKIYQLFVKLYEEESK